MKLLLFFLQICISRRFYPHNITRILTLLDTQAKKDKERAKTRRKSKSPEGVATGRADVEEDQELPEAHNLKTRTPKAHVHSGAEAEALRVQSKVTSSSQVDSDEIFRPSSRADRESEHARTVPSLDSDSRHSKQQRVYDEEEIVTQTGIAIVEGCKVCNKP